MSSTGYFKPARPGFSEQNDVLLLRNQRNTMGQGYGAPSSNDSRGVDYTFSQGVLGPSPQSRNVQLTPGTTVQDWPPQGDDQPWTPIRVWEAQNSASSSMVTYGLSSDPGSHAAGSPDNAFFVKSIPQLDQTMAPPEISEPRTFPLPWADPSIFHGPQSAVQPTNWCYSPLEGSVPTIGNHGYADGDFRHQILDGRPEMIEYSMHAAHPPFLEVQDTGWNQLETARLAVPAATVTTFPNVSRPLRGHVPEADRQSQELVFHLRSGQRIQKLSGRRKLTKDEKTHSRNIRHSGGACERCRRSKKRVCGPKVRQGVRFADKMKCQPWHHRKSQDGQHEQPDPGFFGQDGPEPDEIPEEPEPAEDRAQQYDYNDDVAVDSSSLVPTLGISSSVLPDNAPDSQSDVPHAPNTIYRSPHTFGKYGPGMGGQFSTGT